MDPATMNQAAAVLPAPPAGKDVYVGPRPFQAGETLYGRERETRELVSLLISQRLVLLHAPSGGGKTSLIQAKLVGAMQDEDFEVPMHVLPDNPVPQPVVLRLNRPPEATDPPGCNRYVLSGLVALEQHRPEDRRRPAGELAALSLDQYLQEEFPDASRPPDSAGASGFRPLLLLFDQFEELLTLDPTDRAAKAAFFGEVGAALRDPGRWALFAIRDDYLGALEPYLTTIPTRLNTTYHLDFLRTDRAAEAIENPALAANVCFEDGVVAQLVTDLSQVKVEQADGTFQMRPGPYVEPVHLQIMCRSLWQIKEDSPVITRAHLEALGRGRGPGVDAALATYYADRVAEATRKTGVPERVLRDWFGKQLMTDQGVRRLVLHNEALAFGLTGECLKLLGDAYLIRREQRSGARWYELAHDRLIGPVLDENKAWRSSHLNTFQMQAELWGERERPRDLLASGVVLEQGERWADAHSDLLTPVEDAFLDECRRERELRRQRERRARTMFWTAVLVVVGSLLFSAMTAVFAHRANLERKRANVEKERASDAMTAVRQGLLRGLFDAPPQSVPGLLQRLRTLLNDELLRALREAWRNEEAPIRTRMRAGIALLDADPAGVEKDRLCEGMLETSDPAEVLLLRNSLARSLGEHVKEFNPRLWQRVDSPDTSEEVQFRALAALAAFDGRNRRWTALGRQVVERMLQVDSLRLEQWVEAFRPVEELLRDPLVEVFRGRWMKSRGDVAADILSRYGRDEMLLDLLLDATPTQYAVLWPRLEPHREEVRERLRKELARSLTASWEDAPGDPAWAEPSPDLRHTIEAAGGLIEGRFALCQTLSMARSEAVLAEFRRCGYRPLCYRPYATAGGVQVAAVWRRDKVDWQWIQGVSAIELTDTNRIWRDKGYVPLDVTGYLDGSAGEKPEGRYAAVWVRKDETVVDGQILAVPAGDRYPRAWQPLVQAGYVPRTLSLFEREGQIYLSDVYWKPVQAFEFSAWNNSGNREWYEGNLSPSYLQVDARIHLRELAHPASYWPDIFTGQLRTAEKTLAESPGDMMAEFHRGLACLGLGQDEKALEQFNALIARDGPQFLQFFGPRAVVLARTGKVRAAHEDLNVVLAQLPSDMVLGNAVYGAEAAAYLGEEAGFLEKLEDALRRKPGNGLASYNVARAYALASDVAARGDAGRVRQSRAYAERAVALLYQAIDAGYENTAWIREDLDLRSLHGFRPFVELLRKHRMDWGYGAIWHDSSTRESAESHDLDPAAHLGRCRERIRAGYRPATIAVAEMSPGHPLVTASVWHRPVVAVRDRVELARRQANAAIGLMLLGDAERVWGLLRQQAEPDVRTYLIDRLGPLGADAPLLISRLETEGDVWVRRALLLSLGEFRADQLRKVPADRRQRLASLMERWYRDDPDPGIHAAVAWLSRPGEAGRIRPKLDWGLGAALESADRELTGKAAASRLAAPSSSVEMPAAVAGLARVLLPGLPSRSPSGPDGERRWYVNGQGQTLALFRDPAPFTMGSPGFEPGRSISEKAHRRWIRRNFALGTEPVTVEQFERFLRAHPEVRPGLDRRSNPDPSGPMVGVNWYEAAEYCRWLSELEGVPEEQMCYPSIKVIEKCKAGAVLKLERGNLARTGYRLPTEAEWEYACRAGAASSRSFGWSEEMLDRYAWYSANAEGRAWPVGRKKPNDFGLFDMHGDAFQWCHDCTPVYPAVRPGSTADDREDSAEITRDVPRIQRGATYASPERLVRSAVRWFQNPYASNPTIGFRVARTFP